MKVEIAIYSIIIIILTALYAYFSALENALTLIDKSLWLSKYSNKKKSKMYLLGNFFIDKYLISLNALLIGATLSSVGATALSTILFTDVGLVCGLNDAESFGAGISSGIITVIFLVIGDSIPKTIAKNHPVLVYSYSLYLFIIFYYLFFPFSWILVKIIPNKQEQVNSISRLQNLAKVMNDEGIIDDESQSLITNSINFANIKVSQIIQQKTNIIHLHDNMNYLQVYEMFTKYPYSRIPVLNNKEQVVGIALLKLFLPYLDPNNLDKNEKNFKLTDIIELPLIIKDNENADDTLKQMQLQHVHLAIVISSDEHQTYEGIISMEDIMEEIFGDIHDESESCLIPYEKIDNNIWRVLANVKLANFLRSQLNLNYAINPNDSIYQFVKSQKLKLLWSNQWHQYYWADKNIIISWDKSILDQNTYFIVKKKNQPTTNPIKTSLTKLLFSSKNKENKKDQLIDPNLSNEK